MAELDFVPIPASHHAGNVAINVFAVLSTVALVSVCVRILWLAIRSFRTSEAIESREYIFFHTQLGNYAACLLVGNLLTSTAGLIGIPWLLQNGITIGNVCRGQAFVMQVGNWSTAYFTTVIAIHTFNSLVLKKRQSIMISLPTMIIGWVITGVAAGIPFLLREPEGFVYGPAGLSCGVRDMFPKLQFIFHLLPIFTASLLSVFLYSVIFLVLRGTLNIKGGIKLTLDPHGRWDGDMRDYHRFIARVARSMLWYPVAYVALLVPYSVMRLLDISGFRIAWQAMVFAYVCWYLLGVVNVLLLYNTFRVLGPAFDGRSTVNDTRHTMDSFGPTGYFLEKGLSDDQRSSMEAKIQQYRFPVPLYQFPSVEYHARSGSQASDRSLLAPMYHERSQSVNSIPSLGRPITPVDELNRMLAMPSPAAYKATAYGNPPSLPRLDTSPRSLPAPPRRGISPSPLSIQSSTLAPSPARSPIITPEGIWTPVTPPAARRPVHPPSATFGEREQWATHRISQSWSPNRPALNKPLLSAVTSAFSSPTSGPRPLVLGTASPSTSPVSQNLPLSAASSPNKRPLLLSRDTSVGSVFGGASRPSPQPVPRSF